MRPLQWMLCFMLALSLLLTLARGTGAQNSSGTQDPLAQALQQSNVFVGKTVRGQVDENALNALTQAAALDRPLKIVVVSQLPASGRAFGTRNEYTNSLHDWLGLGRGTLIVSTQNGISAATNAVPAARITQILQQNAFQLRSNLTAGLKQTVADLDAAALSPTASAFPAEGNENNGQPADAQGNTGGMAPTSDGNGTSSPLLWLIPIAGVAGVGLWAGKRAMDKGQAMQQAKQPVERLHGDVVNGIAYADTYLDLLPESPDVQAARSARQQAAGLLEQANALTPQARSEADYGRIQALLEQARQLTHTCRSLIDKATGGTGLAVAVDGTDWRATPATHDSTDSAQSAPILPGLRMEDIPPNERAACFFCSRPARISDLTPITIAVNGQRRKVLACADDVNIIQNGATPQVRSVSSGGGQRVPWYASRGYDPYRDYYRADLMFVPGYGYGTDPDAAFLFGALMAQTAPMPYPVFVDPAGAATVDFAQSGPTMYQDGTVNQGYDNGGYNGSDAASSGSVDSGNSFAGNGDTGVGGISWQGAADAGSAADFSAGSGSVDMSSSSGFSGGADFSSGGSDFGGGGGGGDY